MTTSNENQKFKAGDVVRLKSGGQAMTGEGYSQWGAVMCTWFEGKKAHKETFSEDALEITKVPSRSIAW